MSASVKNFTGILVGVMCILLFVLLLISELVFDQEPLLTGKYYIREVVYDEQDPFEIPQRDTVIVLDQKDGYVKWTLKKWEHTDYYISSERSFFVKHTRPVK